MRESSVPILIYIYFAPELYFYVRIWHENSREEVSEPYAKLNKIKILFNLGGGQNGFKTSESLPMVFDRPPAVLAAANDPLLIPNGFYLI